MIVVHMTFFEEVAEEVLDFAILKVVEGIMFRYLR